MSEDQGPQTVYDVLRGLIRGYPNHEGYQRQMLMSVDAHERGFSNRSELEAELRAQAAALLPPPPPDARDARIAAQELEIAQLRAEAAARAAAYAPPAAAPEIAISGGPAPRTPEAGGAAPLETNIAGGPAPRRL